MTSNYKTTRWIPLFLTAGLVAALANGCTGTLGGTLGDGGADPCANGACGACDGDGDCPTGAHCAGGQCSVECLGDSDCGSGMSCTADGRCALDFVPGTGGAGGSTGVGAGESCADVQITFEPVEPNVVLLIDQSGSMTASYPGGNRWDVLYDALMDPTDGVVKTLEDDVRFGLALYTSFNGNDGGTCPVLTEVNIGLGNHAAIEAVYGNHNPEDETPTGESLSQVAAQLSALDDDGPKIIILATDGEPDTCAQPNPQNGQAESVAAAQQAYVVGVETFVLAVGNDVSEGHLQDMANAGVGLAVDGGQSAPFYKPQDKQGLVDAFTTIIDGQRSCVLTLDGEVDPDEAGQGKVYLDGELLGYDDPNGWKLNSPNEIELVGDACDTIKTGEHTVTGSFPCDALITLPK
jgi:von Willebrand factor type A domain